jgi:hypothetical protein
MLAEPVGHLSLHSFLNFPFNKAVVQGIPFLNFSLKMVVTYSHCGRHVGFSWSTNTNKKSTSSRTTIIRKYGLPAMLCYQSAMISRLDNITQLITTNIQQHETFPAVALQSKLTWSKNVVDPRMVPWQSLLGSINTTFCVLVNLGLWSEINLGTTPGTHLSPYVFDRG